MKYSEIYEYWNKNLCDGGEPNFPFRMFKGKKVLEIGCGSGNDALKFVLNGAKYIGIDLTDKAVTATKKKIKNQGLVYKMNAEFIDYPDNHFDLVYSFGVIHHSINPDNILREAYRVIKPRGYLCIMLYNKLSLRYILDIMFLRKILWHLRYHRYKEIRKKIPHPTKDQWISINTDNLGCPMSRAYRKQEAIDLLYKFRNIRTFTSRWGWFRTLISRK